MDIKGLDYNTQREKLIMPEYGREIQKMVEYACELPTKEERLQCAQAIIRQMETKNPQLKQNADFEQTLWDHLYLMYQATEGGAQTAPLREVDLSALRETQDHACR